jgi:hypothetical protein
MDRERRRLRGFLPVRLLLRILPTTFPEAHTPSTGLWPVFEGVVARPADSEIMFLPQRPYLSAGSLRDQCVVSSSTSPLIKLTGSFVPQDDLPAFLPRLRQIRQDGRRPHCHSRQGSPLVLARTRRRYVSLLSSPTLLVEADLSPFLQVSTLGRSGRTCFLAVRSSESVGFPPSFSYIACSPV